MKLVTTEMTSLVERQSDSHALGSFMEHIILKTSTNQVRNAMFREAIIYGLVSVCMSV